MSHRLLADRLRAGEPVLSAWIGGRDPLVAEAVARAGYEAVTLDMQHGLHDPGTITAGIAALHAVGAPALVRVPVGDFGMVSRALDMGAAAIIAPMIDTVEDARRLADAAKYPPVGKRSWGPARAWPMSGIGDATAFMLAANAASVVYAMIETPQAMAGLDAILAVPGIDGVFVGPSDLSLTLSSGAFVDANHPSNAEPIAAIAAAAKRAGKLAGIFATTPEAVRAYRAAGYGLVAHGTDGGILAAGVRAHLAALG